MTLLHVDDTPKGKILLGRYAAVKVHLENAKISFGRYAAVKVHLGVEF